MVVPSHEGYAYFAERLASYGYIVVSINANRGVNAAPGVAGDLGLNLRRGRSFSAIYKGLQHGTQGRKRRREPGVQSAGQA